MSSLRSAHNIKHLLIVDAHVHVYPCYNTDALLEAVSNNFKTLLAQAKCRLKSNCTPIFACILTERRDCNFFKHLQTTNEFGSAKLVPTGDANCLKLIYSSKVQLLLFAGRQIVTKERLELLSLLSDEAIPEFMPIDETISAIRQARGIPVLNWAPGKWTFNRARVVAKLLGENRGKFLLLGDTTLRPNIYPIPRLMRLGKNRGFGIIYGSDPLPFAGEENWIGSYGFATESEFNLATPTASMFSILKNRSNDLTPIGKRASIFLTMRRLYKNQLVRL